MPSHAPTIAKWFHLPHPLPIPPSPHLPISPLPLPTQILLLTGPSGSGKSTLLRHLHSTAIKNNHRALDFTTLPLPDRPTIDTLSLPLDASLSLLSLVGLAEAHTYLLPPRALSEGQRSRLRLALALSRTTPPPVGWAPPTSSFSPLDVECSMLSVRCSPFSSLSPGTPGDRQGEGSAPRPLLSPSAPHVSDPLATSNSQPATTLLLCDEFAACLDRITALTLSRSLRRLTRHPAYAHLSFALATSHPDLPPALSPDVIIHCDFNHYTVDRPNEDGG